MKHNVLKLSVMGFISCFLVACVAPQTQTSLYAPTAPKSCPSCIAELKAEPGTRLINLKVEINDPSFEIVYMLVPIKDSKKVYISKGSFDGVVQIPDGVDVLITANYDSNTYSLEGGTVIPSNENSAIVNLKITLTSEILTDEFNKLTRDQKKALMQVISLYKVAISSPKMLFSSKLAEAENAANDLYIDMPKEFKETEIHSSLRSIRSYMRLINSQLNYADNGVIGVSEVKKELANFDQAIQNSL